MQNPPPKGDGFFVGATICRQIIIGVKRPEIIHYSLAKRLHYSLKNGGRQVVAPTENDSDYPSDFVSLSQPFNKGRPFLSLCDIFPTLWGNRPLAWEPIIYRNGTTVPYGDLELQSERSDP